MLKFYKKVDSNGKIFIPKVFQNSYGTEYYLVAEDDGIKIVPFDKIEQYEKKVNKKKGI